MDAFKQALGSIPGGWVLDVATGEGEFAETLAGNLGSYAQIVGIDVLEYSQHAESIFCAEHVHFVQMDAGRLGFGDASLDTVSISSSLHHVEDVPRCLGEMVRVLKPGGLLIVRETHRDVRGEAQRMDMEIHHWVAEVDSALGDRHNRTFARQEIVDLVAGLGLGHVVFYDVSNTDRDPMDPAAIRDSEAVIDRYLRHAQRLADHGALRQRGEELRRRLQRTGIQWEPELIIVGEKQRASRGQDGEERPQRRRGWRGSRSPCRPTSPPTHGAHAETVRQ
jgi:SAM-dependent methyltransferase